MRNDRIIAILVGIFLFVFVGGMIWLASTPMMPAPQKMEQAIPDDHIPR